MTDPLYFEWVRKTNGRIPPNAVRCGKEGSGQPQYVARAEHRSGIHPGKAGLHLRGAYISYGGREVHKSEYEVLTANFRFEWVGMPRGLSQRPLVCGYESNGEPLFAARAKRSRGLHGGKWGPYLVEGHIPFRRKEHLHESFQVLCAPSILGKEVGSGSQRAERLNSKAISNRLLIVDEAPREGRGANILVAIGREVPIDVVCRIGPEACEAYLRAVAKRDREERERVEREARERRERHDRQERDRYIVPPDGRLDLPRHDHIA